MNARHPRRRRLLALAAALAVVVALPSVALAVRTRSSERVAVERGETLNDDLYASGTRVMILGDVNGDVYAAGQDIVVEGRISGNLVAAGRTIRVNGDVSGTVLAAGQDIEVNAPVGKDVVWAGQDLHIGTQGRVARDVLAGGANVDIDGTVGKNVTVGAQDFTLAGEVRGGVRAEAPRVSIADGARIGGSLVYRADSPANISSSATIGGETRRLPGRATRTTEQNRVGLAVIRWVRSLIGLALFALILALLFPHFIGRAAAALRGEPLPSLGVGFLVLFAAPIVAAIFFVLGLLAGGWWLGLMLLAVWWIALYVGYIVAAAALGGRLLARSRFHDRPLWPTLLGVLILSIIGAIPVLGWLIVFVAVVLGVGATVLALLRPYRYASPEW